MPQIFRRSTNVLSRVTLAGVGICNMTVQGILIRPAVARFTSIPCSNRIPASLSVADASRPRGKMYSRRGSCDPSSIAVARYL